MSRALAKAPSGAPAKAPRGPRKGEKNDLSLATRARGEVRIAGGALRRSLLPVPPRDDLRPTPIRARQTLFNWIAHLRGPDLGALAALDLFAGSGALGLEAVSRGVGRCQLVELDPELARSLRQTCRRLGVAERVRVTRADAFAFLRRPPEPFDLVFIDPPWRRDWQLAALAAARPWLREGALVYIESDRPIDDAGLAALGARALRRAQAGAARLLLLTL